MKTNAFFLFAVAALLSFSACTDKTITFDSLLQEMLCRDNQAKFPQPYYTCSQFSSYDRQSVAPDQPGWYANWDRSDFIRTETNNGRREFVMYDADGPGAIVRFWVTLASYGGKGILRIYLDGNELPVIEGEVWNLISGGGLVKEGPLATSVSDQTPYERRGHNLYLPIPYAKHCKVTYESASIVEPGPKSGENFYFNINYRTYEKSTRVKSFTMDDLKKHAALIDQVQNDLKNAKVQHINTLTDTPIEAVLDAGKTWSVELKGQQAIRQLTLKLNAANVYQALRSTVLELCFDGDRTVWCPVGDFFGAGYKLSPFKTWYTEASDDGTLTCYWIMPFKKTCTVNLTNLGEQQLTVNGKILSGKWTWDKRSMHFGASWYQQTHLDTGKKRNMEGTGDQFDVNYVTLKGKGVLVGTSVVLFNTANAWWGEGDEKVYVDGETFPSHFGTGTEDYYGYAWGMAEPFSHPFIAQPDGTGNNGSGYTSNIRWRGLDAIPFTKSLQFDLEMWHWAHTLINHAPAAFWYALPGVSSNVEPRPEDAKEPVALVREDIIPVKYHTKGIIEGEDMNGTATRGSAGMQTLTDIGWSNDAQTFWTNGLEGDELSLSFLMKEGETGNFNIKASLTVSFNYGIVSISVNGKTVLPYFDAYSPIVTFKTVNFGKCNIKNGENIIKVQIIGKNPKSPNHHFGLDCIELQ